MTDLPTPLQNITAHTTTPLQVQDNVSEMSIQDLLKLDKSKWVGLVQGMSELEKRAFYQVLEARQTELEARLYDVNTKIRSAHAEIKDAMHQMQRLLEIMAWLGQQFRAVFQTMFSNPDAALRKVWSHQAEAGTSQTALALNTRPDQFGLVDKAGLREMQSGKGPVADFDFEAYHNAYAEGYRLQSELERVLKELAKHHVVS